MVCDWPEHAKCDGLGGGGTRFDVDDDNDPYDSTYPYQPGATAPRYDADKHYYTEASRVTSPPLYR